MSEIDEESTAGASTSGAAEFGNEVRAWREQLELTQAQVATKTGYVRSYVAMVESGARLASEDFANSCDELFSTPGTFARLRKRAVRKGLPEWFAAYADLEQEATVIRVFDCQIVSGLLQTEEYARAVFDIARPDNIEDLVAARMARQKLFGRDVPPRVWVILDEQVLRRNIGGKEVMIAQLERLLEAAHHPRTVLQVVPEAVAAHPGIMGSFSLLSFEEGPDVLHVDGHSQGRMGYDQAEVVAAGHAYDLLRAVALSPEASAELIRGYLEGLKE